LKRFTKEFVQHQVIRLSDHLKTYDLEILNVEEEIDNIDREYGNVALHRFLDIILEIRK
jgi:hypothetical protein